MIKIKTYNIIIYSLIIFFSALFINNLFINYYQKNKKLENFIPIPIISKPFSKLGNVDLRDFIDQQSQLSISMPINVKRENIRNAIDTIKDITTDPGPNITIPVLSKDEIKSVIYKTKLIQQNVKGISDGNDRDLDPRDILKKVKSVFESISGFAS